MVFGMPSKEKSLMYPAFHVEQNINFDRKNMTFSGKVITVRDEVVIVEVDHSVVVALDLPSNITVVHKKNARGV